jgi:hypothetical protein
MIVLQDEYFLYLKYNHYIIHKIKGFRLLSILKKALFQLLILLEKIFFREQNLKAVPHKQFW